MKNVITVFENKIYSAFFDESGLCDIKSMGKEGDILGNIYRARVSKVAAQIKACFVTIEKGMNCFLPFSELYGDYMPKQGDEITVQINREALKSKEPACTMNLQIQGSYCVVSLKARNQYGVSKRINDKVKRQQLLAILERELAGKEICAVFRTNSQNVSEKELTEDLRLSVKRLEEIQQFGENRTLYSRLYEETPFYIKALASYKQEEVEEIVTDLDEVYKSLKDKSRFNVRFYQDERVSLLNLYSLRERIEEIHSKRVYLKCGGYLVIEATEAFNVIDVNSGKADKNKAALEYTRLINVQAAMEAARQIKLRNLSGIIIIDFINTDNEGEEEITRLLSQEFHKDPKRPTAVGFTRLGLFEITRKKETKPT